MQDLVFLPEAAARLRLPESTLRYWRIRREGPPSFRLGRRVVYRQTDLDAWVEHLATSEQRNVHRTGTTAGGGPA